MGLIDFVKGAGRAIFGGGSEPEPKPPASTNDPEALRKFQELRSRRVAAGLVKLVEDHGLKVTDLGIRVDGDVATVSGVCPTQAEREKVVLVIGNTDQIARVNDNLEVSAPEPEAQFHTVVRGDTLSAIAKKYYGKASKYPVIFEANKPMLTDPDKIYPGQVLRIPPVEG